MYRLICLGGLQLQAPAAAAPLLESHRKQLALLAVLAVASERGIPRDRLLLHLWPESSRDSARNALKQLLFSIRSELGMVVTGSGGVLRLDRTAIASDVVEFREALARHEWETAVFLYRGPFLDGFHLPDAPEFERWQEDERRRLAGELGEALEQLAIAAGERRDTATAAKWWARRVDSDPLSSRINREYMMALAANGDRASALQHAARYRSLLRGELGIEPDAMFASAEARLRQPDVNVAIEQADGPADFVRIESGDAEQQVVPDEQQVVPDQSSMVSGRRFPLGRRRRIGVAASLLLIVLLAGYGARSFLRSSDTVVAFGSAEFASRERIVLAQFTTPPGTDSSLGVIATELIRMELQQSKRVRVLSSDELADALERMRQQRGAAVTDSLAREIARRDGIKAVLEGSVHTVRDRHVVTARLVEVETGRPLAQARADAAGAEDFFSAIDRLGRDLRRTIGEPLTRLRGPSPLAAATTPSLEALRHFTEGSRAVDRLDFITGISQLQAAVALDPDFSLAWRKLAVTYMNSGRGSEAVPAIVHAYQLRDRVSERERLWVTAEYHRLTGTLDTAASLLRIVVERYPWDAEALHSLAWTHGRRGDRAAADSAYRAAIQLEPRLTTLLNLRLMHASDGNLAAADSFVRLAHRLYPGSETVLFELGNHYYLIGQLDSAGAVQPRSSSLPRRRALAFQNLAGLERLQGRLAASARFAAEAEAIRRAAREGNPTRQAIDSAVVELMYRRRPDRAAGILRRIREPSPRIAELLARSGAPVEARAVLERWERTATETDRGTSRFAVLRAKAEILAAEGRPDEAIRVYGDSVSYVQLAFLFDRAGIADSAIVHFDRYLQSIHTGRYSQDIEWMPATLIRIGELHEERGEHVAAHAAYGRLLSLWKDADEELSLVVARVRARREAIEREQHRLRMR